MNAWMHLLFKQIADTGNTIIIASRNREEIDKLCDQVYKIENCKLVKQEI